MGYTGGFVFKSTTTFLGNIAELRELTRHLYPEPKVLVKVNSYEPSGPLLPEVIPGSAA